MKNTMRIFIGLALIVLLAGGAYFGAQALARLGNGSEVVSSPGSAVTNPNTNDGLDGMVMEGNEGELAENGGTIEMPLESATELPESEPEAVGFVLEREDDTFTIGTGEPKISVEMNDDGTPNINISGTEGPSVEVVITRDTQIFEDVTDPTAMFSGESESLQQEVKLVDSLEDVDTNDATMIVWGTKRGERVIADVVVVIPSLMVEADQR